MRTGAVGISARCSRLGAVVVSFAAIAALIASSSCKPRAQTAELRDETIPAGKTADVLNELSRRASTDDWRFEVDAEAANRELYDNKIRTGIEFFSAPYTGIKVCPPEHKVQVNGEEACLAFDNWMTYDYGTGKELQKGFVHVIPQKMGQAQPEMEKYMQEGDLIVYFHPEYRGGDMDSEAMQWRASHAATIVMKNGKLATADTPAGYAQPFTGADPTPFHVYRFMPKDAQGNDLPDGVAQKYRQMIAKWATLGFDQFSFTGAYDSAAGQLNDIRPRKNIGKFGDFYLKAAAQGDSSGFPSMYCAWFVFTNLNLAWMFPLNERGLADIPSASLVNPTGTFGHIKRGFQYGGSNAMSSYIDNDPGLVPHDSYAFRPFTAYELIRGFINRLVGPDVADPAIFVARAMNKAGILAGLAQDRSIVSTFASRAGYVPHYDEQWANRRNPEIPLALGKFAQMYKELAEKVQTGQMTAEAAVTTLNTAYNTETNEKENDGTFQYTKRWVPPYIYNYVANNYDTRGRVPGSRPMLAYIGTVLPEKIVKARGAQGGASGLVAIPSTAPTEEDKKLDRDMYTMLGKTPRNDLRGYREFYECLASETRQGCGDKIKQRFTKAEADALLVMAFDWKEGSRLSEKSVLTRNEYGLDSVLFRRLLASYWNNPADSFRPNLLEDSSRAIKNSVLNFRILMASPVALAAEQKPDDEVGLRTRRSTTMPCMTTGTSLPSGTPATCTSFVRPSGQRVTIPREDSRQGWHNQWVQRRPRQ